MNLKLTSFILVLCLVFGAGFYFANETNAQEKTYKIGDKGPAGGWVFYDKGDSSDGWRYLEAASVDQSTKAEWGCHGTEITGAQGTEIGNGKSNTQAIVKNCGKADTAAKLCAAYRGGGKSDWFLPSKDELDLMYINLHEDGVGSFVDDKYWSSSEDKDELAWYQDFEGGSQNSGFRGMFDKNSTYRVRAVRAF